MRGPPLRAAGWKESAALSRWIEGLNDAQREAVTHVEGPLLVLAGPGSGKTRVVTHRIGYLIEEAGVPADSILAVTFTNKAAEEMRGRVERLAPAARVYVATFHRFCARLLRQHAEMVDLDRSFTIVQPQDVTRLVAEIMDSLGLDAVHLPPEAVANRISLLKNGLVDPETFAAAASDFVERDVARVYPILQERLRSQNSVDFDDLLAYAAAILKDHPDVRARLDAQYRFVLVDEYQDTNLAQYAVARALSVDHPNLCATGDPDQSIYSWRGANLSNILSFEADFPGAKVVRLEQNYRSTPNILAVADALIQHNSDRKHKRLTTHAPAGKPVRVYRHRDDLAEARFVAESIARGVGEGRRSYRDFAVFIRTASLSRTFEQEFRRRGIPFQMIGGVAFFDRREVRDLLAYARLLVNPRDDAAFKRIVNTPPRGVGDTTLARLSAFAGERGLRLAEACGLADQIPGLRKAQRRALVDFRRLLDDLSGAVDLSPMAALNEILDAVEYKRLLAPQDEDGEGEEESSTGRWDAVDALLQSAHAAQFADPTLTMAGYLESMSLASDSDGRDDEADKATIMTLHAAKGLEFPVVFLVAFEDRILPHERSSREGNEQEERRLAFVAITRAKEELSISYTARRQYGSTWRPAVASPFLLEIPRDLVERRDESEWGRRVVDLDGSQESGWEEPWIPVYHDSRGSTPFDAFHKGMWVAHPEYGRGVIVAIEGMGKGRKAAVHFDGAGTRHFVLASSDLAPLED
jgi:DNA helicase-2/ATP-dependent DNA helicase PcrA